MEQVKDKRSRYYKGGQSEACPRSLAELPRDVSHISSPIHGKVALLDVAMKAAESPVVHARDKAVLHGIEVNVINMPFQIRVVANCVLPIAALPDALLTLEQLTFRALLPFQTARKTALDQIPSRRKIGVVFWKRPDGMEMIRQDANCDRLERPTLLDGLINSPQAINMVHEQRTRPISEDDREEERVASLRPAISRHL